MILNLFNNVFPFLTTITYIYLYFFTNYITSLPNVTVGILFAFCVFLLTWIFIFLLIWICLLFPALTINKKRCYSKVNNFYYFMLNSWYEYFLNFLRIKIVFNQKDELPKNSNFLLVCNHRSNLDNMVINTVFKKNKICFIAKKEIFSIPFASHYITRSLYLPLDRKNIKQSLQQILKAISYIKNNIISVGVFPEGKRSKAGTLLEFNPGCFKIATKTQCPIVVCTIQGTEKVNKNFPLKKTIVQLDLIRVFENNDYKEKNTIDLSDQIRNLMSKNI